MFCHGCICKSFAIKAHQYIPLGKTFNNCFSQEVSMTDAY